MKRWLVELTSSVLGASARRFLCEELTPWRVAELH
jgi:hypothetical protein